MKPVFSLLVLLFLSVSVGRAQSSFSLTEDQKIEIGRRIWQNECKGTISGLTSWNRGEGFPSLGIAHCIWYPEGKEDRYEESWPVMVRALKDDGFPVEDWMLGDCPWQTREEFMADINGPRLTTLRELLALSVATQAQCTEERLEEALPKMLDNLSEADALKVKTNFERVAREPMGFYPLIDYVNFKGEGTSPLERFNGEGWGLLQVLETMPGDTDHPIQEFVDAAEAMLKRLIKNHPSASRCLLGWTRRLQTYLS